MSEGHDAPRESYMVGDLYGLPDSARALYQSGFYNQAVREAAQAFVNEVKAKSGRDDLDGQALMQHVFSDQSPGLAFSPRNTVVQRDEHDGFRFLALGVARGIRNVLTHDLSPRHDAVRAFEWLVFISAMRRQLDLSYRVSGVPPGGDGAPPDHVAA